MYIKNKLLGKSGSQLWIPLECKMLFQELVQEAPPSSPEKTKQPAFLEPVLDGEGLLTPLDP